MITPTVPASDDNALVKIVAESGLEKTKAAFILEKFQDYFKIAGDWEKKAQVLVVTSATQTAEMKMAREGRLFLKQKRVDIEKARKELKEQSLREGKAIDGIANVLKALIEPIEEYLDRQERFVEIQEEEANEKRRVARVSEIQSLALDPLLYDLKNMPEGSYRQLVDGTRLAVQQKKEAEEKAEAERIAREKADAEEREHMRLENERLQKEAKAKEALIEKERKEAIAREAKAKAEAEAHVNKLKAEQGLNLKQERDAAATRVAKMKAEVDAKLKKERDERERLEAELKAKAEAEAQEKKRVEARARVAERAPDKKKLEAFAASIESIVPPDTKGREAKKIVEDTKILLSKTAVYLRGQIKGL
jgi:hypothetical protein